MKYSFNYGSDVITLPKSAADKLGNISRESLAVLISLAADKGISAKKRADKLEMSIEALESAVRYWAALGVISVESADAHASTAKSAVAAKGTDIDSGDIRAGIGAGFSAGSGFEGNDSADDGRGHAKGRVSAGRHKPSKGDGEADGSQTGAADSAVPLDNSTPHLTIPELAEHAGTESTAWLIEYCQQKMGRMLNSGEAERIVGICDYLGVTSDYVALLCDSLKNENRLTPRAIENLAIELHDRGITDYNDLREYIAHREQAHSFEGKVRKLFGLGSRVFTPAEKKMLERWAILGTNGEMIDLAYELTVSTTGNASLKYANAIIEAWAADGVKSAEEAKKREEDFRRRTSRKPPERKKKPAEQTISSFETDDDFFEKALRRSFGNDFYENVWNGEEPPHGDTDKN